MAGQARSTEIRLEQAKSMPIEVSLTPMQTIVACFAMGRTEREHVIRRVEYGSS